MTAYLYICSHFKRNVLIRRDEAFALKFPISGGIEWKGGSPTYPFRALLVSGTKNRYMLTTGVCAQVPPIASQFALRLLSTQPSPESFQDRLRSTLVQVVIGCSGL